MVPHSLHTIIMYYGWYFTTGEKTKANKNTSVVGAPTTTTRTPKKKKKGPYNNWRDPANAQHLLCAAQRVVTDKVKACKVVAAQYHTDPSVPSIHRRVLRRTIIKLQNEQAGIVVPTTTVTKNKWKKSALLLTASQQDVLQQTILTREVAANKGLTRTVGNFCLPAATGGTTGFFLISQISQES